ncbi:MAG TPA: lipopolysaccharide kinase InaA family protein [Fimbriiglobus sp.]|nr:lipopolysaccharide kinase InaA family protein [Fimbriiglobus sp.]
MFSHFLRKLGSFAGRLDRTVAAGGLVWRVEPAGVELFGLNGPDLTAWEKAGLVEVVKQNLQRTISRVRLPGGTVYVKLCRANTPRSWAREVLRPAKARLEFENALALRKLGIGAVEPLAWGGEPGPLPGDSYLITRAQDAAIPFLDFLEASHPPAVRRAVAGGFARFLARLHDAGVAHPDPHPGNFLVELPKFVLTDLHAVRFGRPLDWPATRANLTLLNRWFQVRASRADRLRFWRTYVGARTTLSAPDADRMARDLETATEVSNLRFWASRTARYRTDNRDSHRVRGPSASGYAVRDLPDELLYVWLADPDAPFAGARLLKDSRTSTVAELTIDTPTGPRAVIYKRFNLKSPIGALKNLLRPSPALRSWVTGNSVRDRGMPTARPLAVFHRTRFGVPLTGYAVFDKVPDALGLPEAVAASRGRPAVLRDWADRLGRLVRRMHDRQVSHRDLKAPNVLISGGEPVLIDLVGVETSRPVPRAVRVRDLARLNASFLGSDVVSRTDLLRCLRAYLGWGLHGKGDWKSWWRQVGEATRAKSERNARAGRPLA